MTAINANESTSMSYENFIVQGKSYINGQWVTAKSGDVFDVINPANNQLLASVANMDEQDVLDAIVFANTALMSWKAKTAKERSVLLKKWYDLILQNKDELSHILTLEQGKPLKESISEILYGASFVEFYAEEAKRIYGDIVPTHKPDKNL
jgi:succinate-semialdehyde dehydrogenase/glutarate-semialdehyde dehydrogenase